MAEPIEPSSRKPRLAGPSGRQVLYTGKSGQLAAMSELIFRGYNAAVPEVDVGDDIFVVRDSTGDLRRVQVKTARATRNKKDDGYFASFSIPLVQLKTPVSPELVYMLVVRHLDRWSDFLVIPRTDLEGLHAQEGIGSDDSHGSLVLRIALRADTAACKKTSLQPYRNNWSEFPPISH